MRKEKKIKSSLSCYLAGGFCAFLLSYTVAQYMIFKNTYEQNFLRESTDTEHLFKNILEAYKETLKKISNGIKEKDLFSNKRGIADYLEKAYAYGIEKESREKVRTSGMNWVSVDDTRLIPTLPVTY
ncbi:MAG: hypothetical protein H0X26_05555 [Alphaproteobacteria bacterium]|nr:hypothetical protein [Alphaproteobacteria bacterium]